MDTPLEESVLDELTDKLIQVDDFQVGNTNQLPN